MDERILKFRVGVMVLATMIITAILVLLFGELPRFTTAHYTLYVHFAEAPGVSKDTPVRKSGVLIGRVKDVKLLDKAPRGVLVSMDIDAERRLSGNEVCRVESSLLGGDATLVWLPLGDERLQDEHIEPNDPENPIEGRVTTSPMRMASDMEGRVAELMDTVTIASRDVSTLSRKLTRLVDENSGSVDRIVERAEASLKSIQTAADSVGEVLGDPQLKSALKTALADLPEATTEMREAIAGMKHTLSLADRNLENIEGFTKPLGDKGPAMVQKIDRSLGQVEKLMTRLTDFTETLNSSEGTIGKLMTDPELYNNINSAACNIERLTRELRPIVADVRVFTDKIARHPESIGVGGAVRRSTGTKN